MQRIDLAGSWKLVLVLATTPVGSPGTLTTSDSGVPVFPL